MGRRSQTGGITPRGSRIQLSFQYEGKQYRPTLPLAPTATNLKAAHRQLADIQAQIRAGTFVFSEWFPDYRLAAPDVSNARTVDQVCQAFITSLVSRGELAHATVESYRKILTFRLESIKELPFVSIPFSQLERLVNEHTGSKKTFNNVVSAIRAAWIHGYKDYPNKANPALGLKGVRIPKRERPKPDPFTVNDVETFLAKHLTLWGEDFADYEEFRFFTGMRPSEQIALTWADCDLPAGTVAVTKARVMGRDKDETKNYEDRIVELCPRALAVIERRRKRWAAQKLAGKANHDAVFFWDELPWHDLQVQWRRWVKTMKVHLGARVRYREPYAARHTSISWNLMIGANFLKVADQHGHSPEVMLKTYAKWLRGSSKDDIQAILKAMGLDKVERHDFSANDIRQLTGRF